MNRSAAPTALTAGLLLTGPLVAGCEDDADGLDSGAGYSVHDALADVPASIDNNGVIFTGDLTRASEVAGLERPTDPASDAAGDWVLALSGGGSSEPADAFVPLPPVLIQGSPAGLVEDGGAAGWSIVDVESFVATSTFVVAAGDFDEDTLSDSLTEVEEGIVSDQEGDQDATSYATKDGQVAAAYDTEAVRAWLDDEESLADDEALVDVAEALDDEDAYAAALYRMSNDDPEDPVQAFDVIGLGWSEDDEGPLVSSVFHYPSEDDAADSVDALRERFEAEPLGDELEVEDADTEGASVVVTARPTDGGLDLVLRAMARFAPPFVASE